MRAKLARTWQASRKLNTPFGQATTPSLEAFRAFALGDEAHEKALDIPEAGGALQTGYRARPEFLPWRMRDWELVVWNSGQVAKARPYYSKAYELSAHVSESERLYISSHYDLTVDRQPARR